LGGRPVSKTGRSHFYGYTYYAREDVAAAYEKDRYGSSLGTYLRELEAGAFLEMLSPGGMVLDVGTGTGKLFSALLGTGRDVAGMDSSTSMMSLLARRHGPQASGRLLVADALDIPLSDRSFDGVVSSRVLMHLMNWRRGVAELCRVARREVILDFPPLSGFTALMPVFHALRAFCGYGRPYKVISLNSVTRELRRHGFRVVEVRRLFFLPIALHRAMDSPCVSRRIEGLLAKVGLTRAFGGPVVIKAIRRDIPSPEIMHNRDRRSPERCPTDRGS